MKTEISGKTYDLRNELKKDGLKWDSKRRVWSIEHEKIDTYYDLRNKYRYVVGLNVKLIDSRYSRDSLYRKEFFDRYHGIFGIYRCAYCGVPLRKKNVTVDHIVPISHSEDSCKCKLFLKYIGAKNINSVKNLTPCCKRCNSRKGAKKSFLTFFKGYIGKTSLGITLRRLCTLISLLSIIAIVIEILLLVGRAF